MYRDIIPKTNYGFRLKPENREKDKKRMLSASFPLVPPTNIAGPRRTSPALFCHNKSKIKD
jgi:hypothetical protein